MNAIRVYQNDIKSRGFISAFTSRIQNRLNEFHFWIDHHGSQNKYFVLGDEKYPYFQHKYNWTWKNERTVEVGYMLSILEQNKTKSILEIGNVLAHYTHISHDVVDKYETADGVINEDIVSFKPKKQYDLIISVSTMEHIGWDEKPRERMKILKALKNIGSLLKVGGTCIFTCPIGYNKDIDTLLKGNRLPVDEKIFMKRLTRSNLWREVPYNEVRHAVYNKPFSNSNAILIASLIKR